MLNSGQTLHQSTTAFASTFYFLQRTKQPHQKIKRACNPPHRDAANLRRHYFRQTEARTDNSGFKKLAVQWLQEVQYFNGTFVQVDSFVLRNRQLLKPTKRYQQPYDDSANIKRK